MAAKRWALLCRPEVEDTFEVTIENADKLGLEIDEENVIRGIERHKKIYQWNEQQYDADKVVYAGDKILMVNQQTFTKEKLGQIPKEIPKSLTLQRQKKVWVFKSTLLWKYRLGDPGLKIEPGQTPHWGELMVAILYANMEKDGEKKVVKEQVKVRQTGSSYWKFEPGETLQNEFQEGHSVTFLSQEEGLKDKVEHIVSAGDVLIPPCCFPFCYHWGRFHIFHDKQVDSILDSHFSETSDEIQKNKKALRSVMNVGEGVTMKDLTFGRKDFLEKQEQSQWTKI